jgi:multisubunit Na+/H+ antiporter MnhG subunit
MRRQTIEVSQQRGGMFSRSRVLELDGIEMRSPDHYTRLLPVSEAVSGGFRLAMLPVRIAALAVLWATVSPTRLIVSLVLATVAGVCLGRA